MNAIDQARQAYSPTQFPLKSSRAIEAQVFAQITARLRKASEPSATFASLVAALHGNRQMWITLAVDLADEDNALPDTLRAQIFSLGLFTNSHTQKVLKKEATAAPLVDINMAILRGLNMGEGN